MLAVLRYIERNAQRANWLSEPRISIGRASQGNNICRIILAFAVSLLAALPAVAYIQTPPKSVKELCNTSHYVLAVQVEKVQAEKNILLFRKVRDLKGKYPGDVIKLANGAKENRVPEGCERLDQSTLMPGERRTVFQLGPVGTTAVFFVSRYDSVKFNLAHLYIGDQWYGYCSAAGDPRWEWYSLLLCESHMRKTFFGHSDRLAECVTEVLAGHDPTVTCLKEEKAIDIHKQPLNLRLGLAKVHRLRASGQPAVPGDSKAAAALAQKLSSPDGSIRLKAATDLNEFLGPELKEAIPALSVAVRDKEVAIRRAAVSALRMAGEDKAVIPALVQAIEDRDSAVRRKAVEAIGFLGPLAKDRVPALLELLKSADASVVASAVEVLSILDPETHRTPAVVAAVEKTADADGKYRVLYFKIKVTHDLNRYGYFHDHGLTEPTAHYEALARAQGYKRSLPRAYWVYAYPYWFLWEGETVSK